MWGVVHKQFSVSPLLVGEGRGTEPHAAPFHELQTWRFAAGFAQFGKDLSLHEVLPGDRG